MSAIEIHKASKIYSGGIEAVKDLSFTVRRGQIFGLLGPNWAGKTTTVKMICGLVTPTQGQIRVNGFSISRERGQVLRSLGVVLEGARNIYWRLSARENLRYFGALKYQYGPRLEERIDFLLAHFDLLKRQDDLVQEFSRGMQQKVALAAALVADPEILLLDEPTLGLDVETSRLLREQIRGLAKEQGKTILLTTHQLPLAQELCDRIAIINHGELVALDSVDRLLRIFPEERVDIEVRGRLDAHLREALLDSPAVSVDFDGENSLVTLPSGDQETLVHLIGILHEGGVELLRFNRRIPTLEEVFMRLVGQGESRRER